MQKKEAQQWQGRSISSNERNDPKSDYNQSFEKILSQSLLDCPSQKSKLDKLFKLLIYPQENLGQKIIIETMIQNLILDKDLNNNDLNEVLQAHLEAFKRFRNEFIEKLLIINRIANNIKTKIMNKYVNRKSLTDVPKKIESYSSLMADQFF